MGKCLCAGVQFEISGKLPNLYQCHCSLCRRQSGTAANAATIVSVAQFSWCAGEDLISRWQKQSGLSSHFCRSCGSPVPNALSADAAFIWVPVGLLDGVESQVVAHLCCDSRAAWDQSVQAHAKCYPGLPDDLQAFVDYLSGAGV